jgi:aspartate/methionine/tyrosine aminotransferase
MTQLSQRAQSLGTENAFVVLAEVNKLIREGQDIISFCIGQPDFHTPQNIQEAGIKAIQTGKHGYTPSAGIPELRQAAADYFTRTRGVKVDAVDVVVGAGAKPFIGYTIQSVTDFGAGDEVIYPVPGFQFTSRKSRPMVLLVSRSICAKSATSASIRKSWPTKSQPAPSC